MTAMLATGDTVSMTLLTPGPEGLKRLGQSVGGEGPPLP